MINKITKFNVNIFVVFAWILFFCSLVLPFYTDFAYGEEKTFIGLYAVFISIISILAIFVSSIKSLAELHVLLAQIYFIFLAFVNICIIISPVLLRSNKNKINFFLSNRKLWLFNLIVVMLSTPLVIIFEKIANKGNSMPISLHVGYYIWILSFVFMTIGVWKINNYQSKVLN